MKTKKIQFANFVFRTGNKVMLDLFDQYVSPVFFGTALVRKYGQTSYIFEEVFLVDVGAGTEFVPAIIGRIVKDSHLKIEQKRVDGELVAVNEQYQTSPSAVFAIYLHNHRMIYMREHVGAPNLDTFKTVVEDFVKKIHAKIVQKEISLMRGVHPRSDWKEHSEKIRKVNELPSVNILPLVSAKGMSEAVLAMDSISKVSFQIIRPNDDANTNPFFDKVREVGNMLGGDKSKTEFTSQDSLIDNSKAASLTEQAINDHNVIVSVTGESGGKKIKCSNSSDDKSEGSLALVETVSNQNITPIQAARRGLVSITQMISTKVLNAIEIKNYQSHVLPLLKRIMSERASDE